MNFVWEKVCICVCVFGKWAKQCLTISWSPGFIFTVCPTSTANFRLHRENEFCYATPLAASQSEAAFT